MALDVELKEKVVEGVLASDRVGEVKFVNIARFLADGVKPQPDPNGQEDNPMDDEIANTLFGQQQETVGLALTRDAKTLIAIDSLNRIRISDFPNAFNIRHMILQHKK